jgi:lysophospholipase L1-like esterase
MTNKILQFIYRFPVKIAGITLLVTILFCWYIFKRYETTHIYYLENLVYLFCAFLLIIGAAKYKESKFKTGILLSLASLLFALALFDFYLITFSFETSAAGGDNVISHRHWYNKYVSRNKYGYWERNLDKYENPAERKKQIVIAVVGDSFTWAQGIRGKNYRFTERLENRLNSAAGGDRVSVLNFGRGGADTLQELEIVEKFVPRIHPDIVLLGYLSNDIVFKCGAEDYDKTWEIMSTITPTVNFIYWRLIGQSTFEKVGLQYMKCIVDSYKNEEIFKEHVKQLDKIFSTVKADGGQPVFVLLPLPSMWTLFSKHTREDIYGRLKSAVVHAGVPVIDLSYFEDKYTIPEFQVNRFDPHPNEKMHEEFANVIYKFLMKDPRYAQLLKKQKVSWTKPGELGELGQR